MPSSSNEVIAEADAPVDLVQQNLIDMVFLPPPFPLTDVLEFQEAYKENQCGRIRFLDSYEGQKPRYDQQIEVSILHTMENWKHEMK